MLTLHDYNYYYESLKERLDKAQIGLFFAITKYHNILRLMEMGCAGGAYPNWFNSSNALNRNGLAFLSKLEAIEVLALSYEGIRNSQQPIDKQKVRINQENLAQKNPILQIQSFNFSLRYLESDFFQIPNIVNMYKKKIEELIKSYPNESINPDTDSKSEIYKKITGKQINFAEMYQKLFTDFLEERFPRLDSFLHSKLVTHPEKIVEIFCLFNIIKVNYEKFQSGGFSLKTFLISSNYTLFGNENTEYFLDKEEKTLYKNVVIRTKKPYISSKYSSAKKEAFFILFKMFISSPLHEENYQFDEKFYQQLKAELKGIL